MKFLAFAVLIAVATAAPKRERNLDKYVPRHLLVKPKIEKPAPPSDRIVGGVEATPHSWPHQVALFIDDMYFCGGSIISSEWIMTAAHCMDGARSVEVVAGAHNIRQDEDTQVSITSTNFFTHESWNPNRLSNDIAMIKLPTPLSLNSNIKTVELPTKAPSVGTIVTPSGWGRPSDSAGGISDVLRQVDVPVMSVSECDAYYGIVTENHVCIDSSGGKGTCNGDSGGPLNLQGTTVGITSFGSSLGCEAGLPDAFTSVAKYLDWIEQNTGVTV